MSYAIVNSEGFSSAFPLPLPSHSPSPRADVSSGLVENAGVPKKKSVFNHMQRETTFTHSNNCLRGWDINLAWSVFVVLLFPIALKRLIWHAYAENNQQPAIWQLANRMATCRHTTSLDGHSPQCTDEHIGMEAVRLSASGSFDKYLSAASSHYSGHLFAYTLLIVFDASAIGFEWFASRIHGPTRGSRMHSPFA